MDRSDSRTDFIGTPVTGGAHAPYDNTTEIHELPTGGPFITAQLSIIGGPADERRLHISVNGTTIEQQSWWNQGKREFVPDGWVFCFMVRGAAYAEVLQAPVPKRSKANQRQLNEYALREWLESLQLEDHHDKLVEHGMSHPSHAVDIEDSDLGDQEGGLQLRMPLLHQRRFRKARAKLEAEGAQPLG